ncbi:MAG: hypothetical protein ABW047_10710 [Nitrospiraceae bacterium]
MKLLSALAMAATILFATTAITQAAGDSNMEVLYQKLKADKKLLIAENMGLTDDEGKKFWPLYDDYQKELDKVNRDLGRTIREYAEAYNKGPVPNDQAKKLMGQVIAIDEAEVKLKRTYAEKIGRVLPTAKTARYIQIESKIRALVKAELAKEIPLVY